LNRFSVTKDGLWLCTNKGIYEFNEKSQTFSAGFLKDMRITADIVQDLEGNHWISSLDQRLFMLPNGKILEADILSEKKRSYACISMGPNEHYFVVTNTGDIIEINKAGKFVREYTTNWNNKIEFVTFVGDTILTNYGFFKIGNPKVILNNVYFGKYIRRFKRQFTNCGS
jgi:hypothetical protein